MIDVCFRDEEHQWLSECLRMLGAAVRYFRAAIERGQVVAENLVGRRNNGLIIIDDFFPCFATSFRIAEINSILGHFNTAMVYSTWHDRRAFSRYAASYPQFASRVRRFHPSRLLKGSAAYVIFLNNIFSCVEYLEKAHLPFVFELYPGGGFYLDDDVSDARLRRVLASPMFRKVIVTQNVTRDYLTRKEFCEREKIEFIYGVVEASQCSERGSQSSLWTRQALPRHLLCSK